MSARFRFRLEVVSWFHSAFGGTATTFQENLLALQSNIFENRFPHPSCLAGKQVCVCSCGGNSRLLSQKRFSWDLLKNLRKLTSKTNHFSRMPFRRPNSKKSFQKASKTPSLISNIGLSVSPKGTSKQKWPKKVL